MHRKINAEKIKTLGKDLFDTVSEMKSIIALEEKVFLKEQRNIYSLRYLLIGAVEAMANICNHILTRVTGQVPKGYPDCFEKLSDARIIKRGLGVNLKKLASLRNILIHKYWEIDDRKVFQSAKENIGYLEEFLKQIMSYLKQP